MHDYIFGNNHDFLLETSLAGYLTGEYRDSGRIFTQEYLHKHHHDL